MKSIVKYLSELETITGNVEQYHQKSSYWTSLKKLRNKATTEAAILNENKKGGMLSRCDLINERFEKFWPKYFIQHKAAREGNFRIEEFEENIYCLFIGQPEKPRQVNLLHWLHCWHDAVMIKQGELSTFQNHLLTINGNSSPQPEKEKKEPEITKLSEAFEDISKYKKVMEIFVSKGFIYPHTYKWKYKKSGFRSLIFAFLKDMEGKDYFKEDVKLNYDLCKTIALNTFGIEIKSNKTYYNSVLPPDLDKIIPPETARN
jgi:hypothetical protein